MADRQIPKSVSLSLDLVNRVDEILYRKRMKFSHLVEQLLKEWKSKQDREPEEQA